jgi:hypothetical protein
MVAVVTLSGCSPQNKQEDKSKFNEMSFQEQKEEAIRKASLLFREKREKGEDLSSGPCIAEEIAPGWSADIAHLPRITGDDLPKNQCKKYANGETKHFVELSTDGDLIRVR